MDDRVGAGDQASNRCFVGNIAQHHVGLDTGKRSDLLAADMSVGEIRDYLGVDSLAYLDLDNLIEATGSPAEAFCTACFSGEYPVPVAEAEQGKNLLEAATGA